MSKSSIFFVYLAVCGLLIIAALAHAIYQQERRLPELREKAKLVRTLELTDLCLFNEARYTRHPSQADKNAPFQDHPCSLEHFPSGSLLMPVPGNSEEYVHLD